MRFPQPPLLQHGYVRLSLSLVLTVGLIAGLALTVRERRSMRTEIQNRIVVLTAENRLLLRHRSHLRYLAELSREFSIDPSIVALVDRYARRYLKHAGREWNAVKTPETLTPVFLSLIHEESGGDPAAIGDGGRARGLTQIWTSTARQYGEVTPEQLLDPETNVAFSFRHFHYLLEKYQGNLALTLYAWNRGAASVDRAIHLGRPPEKGYGHRVYQEALLRQEIVARAEAFR